MKKMLAAIEWRDVAGVSGAGLICIGVAMIYRPAGFIVAGAFMLAGAILFSRSA
jgi:hypothetical protein